MASPKTTKQHHSGLFISVFVLLLLMLTVAGCSQSAKRPEGKELLTPQDTALPSDDKDFDLLDDSIDVAIIEIWDPLEGVNRVIFNINDSIYTMVLDPVFETWEVIIPQDVRTGVDNFFANITTPARFINCLLQGKNEGADIEYRRLWINTTEGILGFGDPAFEKYGLEPVEEDLGQTLAVWGLGDGLYIVWPLLGPSTARDTVGMVGDWYANPVRWVAPTDVTFAAAGVKGVNKGSFHAGEYEVMFSDEVDPYVAARQAYLQYRKKLIEE
jgi:phospholipid-binding lipoprotein MlaA